ncbi:MAG: flippase-like domain-containing protein [Thiohalocapsa sp.]
MNRALRFLGLLLGLAVLAWLVLHSDIAALRAAFEHIGWGFVLILLVRAATVAVNAAAWAVLLPRRARPSFATMLPLKWIGESINTTLPAAQIGGDVVRAQLLQRRVKAPARGAASVAVDFFLSFFAQILFTLLGFVLLARLGDREGWWWAALSAAAAAGFALVCWELLVRRRLLMAFVRSARRLGQQRLAGALTALGEALRLVVDSRAALAAALFLHVAGYLAHAAEVWLTLYLMGAATGFAAAALLESLSLAARSAAFLIPSGWGAQEASLIALASLAGLSPETALALGLVKRAREFAIGLPGLAAWAILEWRRPRP